MKILTTITTVFALLAVPSIASAITIGNKYGFTMTNICYSDDNPKYAAIQSPAYVILYSSAVDKGSWWPKPIDETNVSITSVKTPPGYQLDPKFSTYIGTVKASESKVIKLSLVQTSNLYSDLQGTITIKAVGSAGAASYSTNIVTFSESDCDEPAVSKYLDGVVKQCKSWSEEILEIRRELDESYSAGAEEHLAYYEVKYSTEC